MPRKYEKKTKGNFRTGRRAGARRVSMRLSMLPPGVSLLEDDYSAAIDDTLLFLQAKGKDRERERFVEALNEVQERIIKIIDDYDSAMVETSYAYRDYIDELEEQVSLLSGGKLKQNIMRILTDYHIVCEERAELLVAVNECLTARTQNLFEIDPDYDEDEFDFDDMERNAQQYAKTVRWLSDKFKDMDARVHVLKKRENAKGASKGAKSKRKNAKTAETPDKVELKSSKERLETWKFAADEIVGLLNTVRQEGEGGKEALEFELQKIMNIMNNQNEEIMNKTKILEEEKQNCIKLKQNDQKLLNQNKALEAKLTQKRSEVNKCKQYIEEMVKKFKNSKDTNIHFDIEDPTSDANAELSTLMRRRFTVTDAPSAGLAELRLKDAHRKVAELEEEKHKLEKDMTKLHTALTEKDMDLSELKKRLVVAHSKHALGVKEDGSEVQVLERKLEESAEELEDARVEMVRMKRALESSGKDVITYASEATQTLPTISKTESSSEKQLDSLASTSASNYDLEENADSMSATDHSTASGNTVPNTPLNQRTTPHKTSREGATPSTPQQLHQDSRSSKNVAKGRLTATPAAAGLTPQDSSLGLEDRVSKRTPSSRGYATPSSTVTVESAEQSYVRGAGTDVELEDKAVQTMEDFSKIQSSMAERHFRRTRSSENASQSSNESDWGDAWKKQLKKLGKEIKDVLDKTKDVTVIEAVDHVASRMDNKAEEGWQQEELEMREKQRGQRKKSIFERLLENNAEKSRKGHVLLDGSQIARPEKGGPLLPPLTQSLSLFTSKAVDSKHQIVDQPKDVVTTPDAVDVKLQTAEKIDDISKPKPDGITTFRSNDFVSAKSDEAKLLEDTTKCVVKDSAGFSKSDDLIEPQDISRKDSSFKPSGVDEKHAAVDARTISPKREDVVKSVSGVKSKEESAKPAPSELKTAEKTQQLTTTLPRLPQPSPPKTTPRGTPNKLLKRIPSPLPELPEKMTTKDAVAESHEMPLTPKRPFRQSKIIQNQSGASRSTRGIHCFEFPGKDSDPQSGDPSPYIKPFKVRRKSIFGHSDIADILAGGGTSAGGGDCATSPSEKCLLENMYGADDDDEDDNIYHNVEWRRASTDTGQEIAGEEEQRKSGADDDGEILSQKRLREKLTKINRGVYRPSLHKFIGITVDEHKRLAAKETARERGMLPPDLADSSEDDEAEIEVGSLLTGLRRNNLRRTFLRIGLMHLKGTMDNISSDERLTMEDQVNIIAQTTIEVLKSTYNLFLEKGKGKDFRSTPLPSYIQDRLLHSPRNLPPVNSPEIRSSGFESRTSGNTSHNSNTKELQAYPGIGRQGISMRDATPENATMNEFSNWTNDREQSQRTKALFARLTSSRKQHRPFARGHNFPSAHRSLMEKILGARMSTVAALQRGPVNRFATGHQRLPLATRRQGSNNSGGFSISAQAIKVPTKGRRISQNFRPPMKKSASTPSHELSITSRRRDQMAPTISKAQSDQTHYSLMLNADGISSRTFRKR